MAISEGLRSARDARTTLIQNLSIRGAEFAFLAALARLVTQDDMGFFFLFRTVVLLVSATICVGLPISITRHTAMNIRISRTDVVRGTAETALRYSLLASMIIALGFYVFGPNILPVITEQFSDPTIILTLSISIVAQVLISNMSAFLNGCRKFTIVAGVSMSATIMRVVPGTVAAAGSGVILQPILWWTVGDAFAAILFVAAMFRIINPMQKDPVSIAVLLRVSAPILVSYYINTAYLHVERFFVLLFTDLASLAVYSIASTLTVGLSTVYSSFSSALFPSFSQSFAGDGKAEMLRKSHAVSRLVSLAYFPVVALTVLLAPLFIPLMFTEMYSSAILIFAILACGSMFGSLGTSISSPALAAGETKTVMIGDMLGFLGFFLISSLGAFLAPLISIASARGVMMALGVLYIYNHLWKRDGKAVDWMTVRKIATIAIIMMVSGTFIGQLLPSTNGLFIALGFAVSFCILSIRRLELMTVSDARLVMDLLPSVFGRVLKPGLSFLAGKSLSPDSN